MLSFFSLSGFYFSPLRQHPNPVICFLVNSPLNRSTIHLLNPSFRPESQKRFRHKQRLEIQNNQVNTDLLIQSQNDNKYDVAENNNDTGNCAFMSLSDNPLATVFSFISIICFFFFTVCRIWKSLWSDLFFEGLVMWRGDEVSCILFLDDQSACGFPFLSSHIICWFRLIRLWLWYFLPVFVSLVIGSWCSPEELIW